MWYFGELPKLRAYRVVCYVFQVLLRTTGRRRLDCTHLFEIMFEDSGILSDILLIFVLTIDTLVVFEKCDIDFYVV